MTIETIKMLKTINRPNSNELKGKIDHFFFSRAELNYLKGEKSVNSNYERVLLHRIYKKLDCFREEILPMLANNNKTRSYLEITENSNIITNFSNILKNKELLKNSLFLQNSDKMKWTGGDLNPRPPECKSGVRTS